MEPSWNLLGHPDLLDKLHFATRGGVSKASKEINLSEDIFSGYKTVLAGGCVVFREYHHVGKGRPTNLIEITGFFAKLSSGSAASLTTRDVARFAASAPLVKLFSYYYSAIAFYVHDVIVMHVTVPRPAPVPRPVPARARDGWRAPHSSLRMAEQVLIPYLLAMLALVGLDHRFNNYETQPLSLFALLPLLLSFMTALPGSCVSVTTAHSLHHVVTRRRPSPRSAWCWLREGLAGPSPSCLGWPSPPRPSTSSLSRRPSPSTLRAPSRRAAVH